MTTLLASTSTSTAKYPNTFAEMNTQTFQPIQMQSGTALGPAPQQTQFILPDNCLTTACPNMASASAVAEHPQAPAEMIPNKKPTGKSRRKGNKKSTNATVPKTYRGGEPQFPWMLHKLLADAERDGLTSVISWMPCGRVFKVHQRKLFLEMILPKYVRQSKYKSFVRSLNLWGFSTCRPCCGKALKGSYFHHLFIRGAPMLSHSMVRTKIKKVPNKNPKFCGFCHFKQQQLGTLQQSSSIIPMEDSSMTTNAAFDPPIPTLSASTPNLHRQLGPIAPSPTLPLGTQAPNHHQLDAGSHYVPITTAQVPSAGILTTPVMQNMTNIASYHGTSNTSRDSVMATLGEQCSNLQSHQPVAFDHYLEHTVSTESHNLPLRCESAAQDAPLVVRGSDANAVLSVLNTMADNGESHAALFENWSNHESHEMKQEPKKSINTSDENDHFLLDSFLHAPVSDSSDGCSLGLEAFEFLSESEFEAEPTLGDDMVAGKFTILGADELCRVFESDQ